MSLDVATTRAGWSFRQAALLVAGTILGVLVLAGVVPFPDVAAATENGVETLGPWLYAVVAVVVFAETAAFLGFVAPAELVLLVAGTAVRGGHASLPALAAVASASAFAGDSAGFLLGRRLGSPWLERHGARFGLGAERLRGVQAFVRRRGAVTLFAGRFIGVIRPLVPFSVAAGGMSYRRFAPVSAVSAAAWSIGTLVLGGLAGGWVLQHGEDVVAVTVLGALGTIGLIRLARRGRGTSKQRGSGR
jgi:membrane protein DedA with SNARE-associated domain